MARELWAVWLRCSLLTGRCGHARRSRLAIPAQTAVVRRGRVFQQAPRRGALFPQELPSPATAQENRAALGSVLSQAITG